MDNYDDLSNEQLRLKLLEYGLANMPVTQTTRKVLIKKLKNHVENANSKVRRETIHVAKYSSDEDSSTTAEEPKKTQRKEINRRVTIGGAGSAAAKLSKTLPVMPQLPPPKPVPAAAEKVDAASKRRSGRLTPVLSKDDPPATTVAAPREPMIVEDSDPDDEIPMTQLKRRSDRKSKSPSLSRAEMVSTSYIHQVEVEVASKPPIAEEMEIDLTESTDDVVAEPPEEPEPRARRPPVTPSRESRYTTSATSTTSTNKRTTISSGLSGLSQTRTSGESLSSSFGRPSLSTTYNYNAAPQTPRPEEPTVSLQATDSPYLSEFTKRLSRLKAESAQLNAVRDHPIRRTIASSYGVASSPRATAGEGDYVQSRLTAVRGGGVRPDVAPGGKGEIRASLRQVILSLDQKYSIKRMFYLLIVLLVVIFLFVFFFL